MSQGQQQQRRQQKQRQIMAHDYPALGNCPLHNQTCTNYMSPVPGSDVSLSEEAQVQATIGQAPKNQVSSQSCPRHKRLLIIRSSFSCRKIVASTKTNAKAAAPKAAAAASTATATAKEETEKASRYAHSLFGCHVDRSTHGQHLPPPMMETSCSPQTKKEMAHTMF
jgi:hypothetical protein